MSVRLGFSGVSHIIPPPVGVRLGLLQLEIYWHERQGGSQGTPNKCNAA